MSGSFQLTAATTSDNMIHGKSQRSGQTPSSADNEKGAGDQDRQAQKISQVGREHDDRKGDASAHDAAPARSGWFDDETCEIYDHPPNEESDPQSEFGWF